MTDRKDVARKALETAKIYSSGFESTLGGPALSLKEVESLGPQSVYWWTVVQLMSARSAW